MSAAETIPVRAAANKWISDTFPGQRKYISHSVPVAHRDGWLIHLLARCNSGHEHLGDLFICADEQVELLNTSQHEVENRIKELLDQIIEAEDAEIAARIQGEYHDFRLGDGIQGASLLEEFSVDLLLTDPPYGISNPYICEQQVPRRLRKNGRDFIMPKGHFGDWDNDFPLPDEWTGKILPKVRGWAVIFCAQTQIGDYVEILRRHRFSAVGPMVWQKTNPVPFNHKHKPINAWEAIVVGKRPGTPFNGHVTHNVFVCKSPSPQQRIHPTQKPLDLIARFVELFSQEGDLVLDPFAGSGTTLVAARQLGRQALGYERDPAIFQAAAARINEGDLP